MHADVKGTEEEEEEQENEKKKKGEEKKEKKRDVQLWNSNKVLNKCRDGFEVGKMDERELSSRKPLELWQVSFSSAQLCIAARGGGDKN